MLPLFDRSTARALRNLADEVEQATKAFDHVDAENMLDLAGRVWNVATDVVCTAISAAAEAVSADIDSMSFTACANERFEEFAHDLQETLGRYWGDQESHEPYGHEHRFDEREYGVGRAA